VEGMNNVRMEGEEELEGQSIQGSDVAEAEAEEVRREEESGRRDLNSDGLAQVQEDTQGSYSDKHQAEYMWGSTDMQTPLCIPYDHHMDVYEHESRRLAWEGLQHDSDGDEEGDLRFCFQFGLDPSDAVLEHTRWWDQDPWRRLHEVCSIEHWADIQKKPKFQL